MSQLLTRRQLLTAARQAIADTLAGQRIRPLPLEGAFGRRAGLFVSLHKHGNLRGCIGDIIAHQPLVDSIQGNAVNAATQDPRFDPVQPGELAAIDIEISVLTPMQTVADWKEIVVGRDGVLLTKGFNRGVFLPQVPTEQGWNLTQYLDNLARKAGLPFGQWKDAKLEKFQAIVFGEKE